MGELHALRQCRPLLLHRMSSARHRHLVQPAVSLMQGKCRRWWLVHGNSWRRLRLRLRLLQLLSCNLLQLKLLRELLLRLIDLLKLLKQLLLLQAILLQEQRSVRTWPRRHRSRRRLWRHRLGKRLLRGVLVENRLG